MSIKAGGDLRYSRMKVANINTGQQGSYRFTNALTASGGSSSTGGADLATFLLGVPSSVTLNSSTFMYYYRWKVPAFFLQNGRFGPI